MAISKSNDFSHPSSGVTHRSRDGTESAFTGQEIFSRPNPQGYGEIAAISSTDICLGGLSLVDDILYRILDMSWLSWDGFIKSLSLTSRRLRMICLPYLFREHSWHPAGNRGLLPQSLWRFIRVFHLNGSDFFDNPKIDDEDIYLPLILALSAMPFLRTFKVSYFPDALWRRLMTGIVYLPTLECLEVYHPLCAPFIPLNHSPRDDIGFPSPLELETPLSLVRYVLFTDSYDRDLYNCLATLKSSSTSLRSLRVSGGPKELDYLKTMSWPKLQELTLTLNNWYADVSPHSVAELLANMPVLKTLGVSYDRPMNSPIFVIKNDYSAKSVSAHYQGSSYGVSPELTTLTISGAPSTDDLLGHLPRTLQTLHFLEGMGHPLCQDEFIFLLEKSQLPNVVTLVFAIDATPKHGSNLFSFLGSKCPLLRVLEVRQRGYHGPSCLASSLDMLGVVGLRDSGLRHLEILRLDLPAAYSSSNDAFAEWAVRIATYVPWVHEIAFTYWGFGRCWSRFQVRQQLNGPVTVELCPNQVPVVLQAPSWGVSQ